MYNYRAKKLLIIEILWRWHNLLEKWFINVWIYHTLNITELSNGRRQLTTTFAKCNLHKWNTLYTYYCFTQCAKFDFWNEVLQLPPISESWLDRNSYVPFSLQKVRRLFNVPCWPVMATWGRDAATWNLPTSLDGWLGGWSTFIIWPYVPWKTVVKAVTWACLEKTFPARVFRRILCLHSSDSKKLRINCYCRMVFCVFLFVCLFVCVCEFWVRPSIASRSGWNKIFLTFDT